MVFADSDLWGIEQRQGGAGCAANLHAKDVVWVHSMWHGHLSRHLAPRFNRRDSTRRVEILI